MKYYQELTAIPSMDVPVYFIWSKVYQQMHVGFAERQDEQGIVPFGVSFPQYKYDNENSKIGEKMRVFANSEDELNNLGVRRLLQRLSDYVHITGIRAVPEKKDGYAVYRRVHTENRPEQKVRRFMNRHKGEGADHEQLLKIFSAKTRECYLPYIRLKSLTNHNSFSLFIAKSYCATEVYSGFGTYGLSNISTVPEF